MSDIKFRAWDNFKKEMRKVDKMDFHNKKGIIVWFLNGEKILYPKQSTEIMQYTGLKDKNGKEIYEGDIVKIDDNELYKITFKSGAFRATPLNKEALSRFCSDSGIIFVYLCRDDNVEVIGNIYENKELLEEQK